MAKLAEWENSEEIKLFREYIRIQSVHPDVDYGLCIEFLKRQAADLDLPYHIFYPVNEQNPIFIITWAGLEPSMTSIMLNSHMDVVPVYEENWAYPPFAADMDSAGKIYGRGTQDCKSVGMQYLAAIRFLKKSGQRFKRTIHITFVPDEEMGGALGMRPFVQSNDFKCLNVGFSLDEGSASPIDIIPVYYGERSIWRICFKFKGTAGHGSGLVKNTAGEKMYFILHKIMEVRQKEVKRLESDPKLFLGDVTTLNVTRITGGKQTNVIPPFFDAFFDVRLSLDTNHAEFESKLKLWCEQAGGDVEIEYEQKDNRVEPTDISEKNIFWMAFKSGVDDLNLPTKALICPGGTDSRYLRSVGIPALGFSPMPNTEVLLHTDNEYVSAETFLRGIEIYKVIISKLANATKCYCSYARTEN